MHAPGRSPPAGARAVCDPFLPLFSAQVEKEIWPTLENDGPARVAPPPPAAAAAAAPVPAPAPEDDKPAMPKPYASKRDWNAVEQVWRAWKCCL